MAFFAYPEPGPRVNFTTDKLRIRLAMQRLIGQPAMVPASQLNIGVAEAMAIDTRRDQIVLAEVVARECRRTEAAARSQCEREDHRRIGGHGTAGSRERRGVAQRPARSCSSGWRWSTDPSR